MAGREGILEASGGGSGNSNWVPLGKTQCTYGERCTRQNPKHFAHESHPPSHHKVKEYRISGVAAADSARGAAAADDVIIIEESSRGAGRAGRAMGGRGAGGENKRGAASGAGRAADDDDVIVVEEGSSQVVKRARRGRGGRFRNTWSRPLKPADCPICLCEFEVDKGVVLTACR